MRDFQELFAGRQVPAVQHFRWVKERGTRIFVEYGLAVAELRRLEKLPSTK